MEDLLNSTGNWLISKPFHVSVRSGAHFYARYDGYHSPLGLNDQTVEAM